jgi:hypothetical protein
MQPGRLARRDTTNIFCGVEPKAGAHFEQVTETRAAQKFAGFLKDVADAYPEAKIIHLVMRQPQYPSPQVTGGTVIASRRGF